jgi:hypothetical protein
MAMRLFTISLLTILFGLGLVALIEAAEEQVVFQISGNGARNLRPFTVRDNWEIRWESKSQFFGVDYMEVNPPADDLMASLPKPGGTQAGPGSGSSYQPKGGTYYLRINSMGDWTVAVIQLH